MNEISTVLEVLKQILVAVGIISGSSLLTGLVNAIANIKNTTVKHILSWVLPIGVAELLCAIGTVTFGFGGWDYLFSAVAGAAVGAMSNGLYDWKFVSDLIDKLYDLFGHRKEQLG